MKSPPAKKRVRKPKAAPIAPPEPSRIAFAVARWILRIETAGRWIVAKARQVGPWILARSLENSTWRGIIALTGSCASFLNPHFRVEILAFAIGAIGFLNAVHNTTDPPKP